jgi:hypothetical protein
MPTRLPRLPKLPRQKHTVKLKVIFSSTDIKSSDEDAARLGIELERLLDKFKPKSLMASRELSVEGHTYAELKNKGGKGPS